MTYRSTATRIAAAALLGSVPFVITAALPASHRSPYVIAYPAVILSAWLWEAIGAVATALVAGLLIEHFVFISSRVPLGPPSTGSHFRVLAFVLGSILAGTLTRRAAKEKERQIRLVGERQLALAIAEKSISEERERNRDLARENEVRAELALEGADLGLWEWDLRTDKSRWSPGFYRLHKLSPEVEADHALWSSLVDPRDRALAESEMQEAIRTEDSFTSEYRLALQQGNGDEKWIGIGGKVVADEEGNPITVAGYCVDLTRRKRTEAALIQTEKLALAGRMAATIAHEINNPLEAAVNLIYLSRAHVDPEHCEYLDEALRQIDRVASIAHQTLRFSKRSGGPSSCVPAKILQGVLTLLRPRLEVTKTELLLDLRSEQSTLCVTGELQQVLINILNNAIEAMGRQGRLRIRVSDSARWNPSKIPGLRITISDNGSGMSPEVLSRMSEPFFTTKAETGTGLGMWVTYELVERCEGKLSVRTCTAGSHRGTVFSLFLPARP